MHPTRPNGSPSRAPWLALVLCLLPATPSPGEKPDPEMGCVDFSRLGGGCGGVTFIDNPPDPEPLLRGRQRGLELRARIAAGDDDYWTFLHLLSTVEGSGRRELDLARYRRAWTWRDDPPPSEEEVAEEVRQIHELWASLGSHAEPWCKLAKEEDDPTLGLTRLDRAPDDLRTGTYLTSCRAELIEELGDEEAMTELLRELEERLEGDPTDGPAYGLWIRLRAKTGLGTVEAQLDTEPTNAVQALVLAKHTLYAHRPPDAGRVEHLLEQALSLEDWDGEELPVEHVLEACRQYDALYRDGDPEGEQALDCYERQLHRFATEDGALAPADLDDPATQVALWPLRLHFLDALLNTEREEEALALVRSSPDPGLLYLWDRLRSFLDDEPFCAAFGHELLGGRFDSVVIADPLRCPRRPDLLLSLSKTCGLGESQQLRHRMSQQLDSLAEDQLPSWHETVFADPTASLWRRARSSADRDAFLRLEGLLPNSTFSSEELYRLWARNLPEDPHPLLALAALRPDEPREALVAIESVDRLFPGQPDVQHALALALFLVEDFEAAAKQARELRRDPRAHPHARAGAERLLGRLAQRDGELERAFELQSRYYEDWLEYRAWMSGGRSHDDGYLQLLKDLGRLDLVDALLERRALAYEAVFGDSRRRRHPDRPSLARSWSDRQRERFLDGCVSERAVETLSLLVEERPTLMPWLERAKEASCTFEPSAEPSPEPEKLLLAELLQGLAKSTRAGVAPGDF